MVFRYLCDESGLNRKNIIDNRVHCCFYFISPYGHSLKPLDIDFMKELSNKVSIVPIIAKSDCLTMKEIAQHKERILEEIKVWTRLGSSEKKILPGVPKKTWTNFVANWD